VGSETASPVDCSTLGWLCRGPPDGLDTVVREDAVRAAGAVFPSLLLTVDRIPDPRARANADGRLKSPDEVLSTVPSEPPGAPSTKLGSKMGDKNDRSPPRESQLVDFGFRAPRPSRGYQIAVVRGGSESRRRWLITAAISLLLIGLTVLVLLRCGNTGTGACGWETPLAVLAVLIVPFALTWWYMAAVPPDFEDPRHLAVAGQLAAGQRTYPSQDAILDPNYGQPPPS